MGVIDELMAPVEGPKRVHMGEKAKEKTFWDCTRMSIDSWEVQGKALVVHGYGTRTVKRNWREYHHIVGYEHAWKVYFPASVCAVDEYPDGSLVVLWPMWLQDVKAYPERDTTREPGARCVSDVRDGSRVDELKLTIVSMSGKPRSTAYGQVMDVYGKDEHGNGIRVTLWNGDIERVLGAPGEAVVTIKNGWAKSYKGVLSVSAGKYGTLEVEGSG